ncbi:AAA family ATPase [uncultured Roseobacter sp.]|uniref:AAA family ATPase n=1 Tax=uncultured Roseobacter sp. TaxID=114847 RepID=UPI002635C118|nr:AAA family ATPase [uncultured Roseobacter sp.]
MIFQFLTYELDTDRRELREQDQPVALTPKAFDVLCYLVEHRDRMVAKAELLDAFWSAQVSEAALQKTVSLIRKAVVATGATPEVLKTYHGLGFRFVADVVRVDHAPQEEARPAVSVREQRFITALCVRLNRPAAQDNGKAQFDLADALEPAKQIVERYEGSLLRMMLEGFTVSFGLETVYEDGARRAAHCALELKTLAKLLSRDGSALSLSMGLHSGAGDLRSGDMAEVWVAPGEIERAATRIAETAAPGEILISGATKDQLGDEVESVAASTGYRLIRMAEMQAGVPARPRKTPASFVGRSAELGFLNRNLELMIAGNGQALALSGPAGIGKTRLVSEFLAGLEQTSCRHVTLHCLPGLCNSPGAPIVDLCRTLFPQAPEGAVRDHIDAALLRELHEDPPEKDPALKALSDHQHRSRSYALVNRMLKASSDQHPIVIVIEDTHWIDATSQMFLDAIVREIDAKRLMVLMTTRPTETPPLAEGVLQLSPLGHADSLRLLHQNTEEQPLARETAERLVQRAAGNPFFIEELALAAHVGSDRSTDLPDTVQAVIAVRIGALEVQHRVLIYIIAVIGPPARQSLIEALTGLETGAVDAALDHLMRAGFLQVEADGYSFRHMLIQDTAYATVAPDERQRLHREIAQLLESADFAGQARPETLAWHHQEAGQKDAALDYWIKASRDALRRSARQEAVVFARNGLQLIEPGLGDTSRQELDLQLCLASTLGALRGYGAVEVGEAYRRARVLNGDIGNQKADVRILVGLWIHTWVRGQLTESLNFARRLAESEVTAKDPARKLQAEASVGQVLVHKGAITPALAHLTAGLRSVEHAPPATLPSQNAAVACASYAAWATSLGGQCEEARRFIALAQRLSQTFENPFAEAIHHALCAEPCMFMQDAEGCLALADRAVVLSREHGFDFWLGTGLVMRGWALSQTRHMDAAFSAFDEGLSVFEATGARVQLANWYGLKAEAHLVAGQLEEGCATAAHALECAGRAEDMFFVPRIHTTLSMLHRKAGAEEAARAHAEQATRLARSFGMTIPLLPAQRLSR